jgi:mono/diheme cytochrome c family protein
MNSPANQPIAATPREDTSAQDPAVPIWLIVVLFLMCFWGAVYFDNHGGWFDAQIYGPYVSAEELKSFQVAGGPNVFEQGRAIYGRTCVTCHGPAGAGQAGTFPSLAGSDWVNEQQPGRMIRLVLQGFSGPGLKVNGAPFSTGSAMVPWNSLSDDDIAAVITFVRGNKEWGNKASVVTPEQVHAMRGKVQGHPLSFSPTELEGISPAD